MGLEQMLSSGRFVTLVELEPPKGVNTCRKYMRNAIRAQLEGHGLGLVEALTACPVQWGMTPVKAVEYIDNTVVQTYPPGEIVNRLPDARKKSA